MLFRTACLVPLLAVLLLASAAFAQPQSTSLGDIGRAPKGGKKAARIYTNDDIPSRPAAPAPAAAAKDGEGVAPGTGPATSDDSKQTSVIAILQKLKAREGKLIKDRDKLQQNLQSETEDLRRQALTEMLHVINQDLQGVSEHIALLSKLILGSRPSDAPQPDKPILANASN